MKGNKSYDYSIEKIPLFVSDNVPDPLAPVGCLPGILVSVTHQPDQAIQHMVLFQHDGVWLAATGYINLLVTDAAMLDRYSAVIFYIMSSFDIAEQ